MKIITVIYVTFAAAKRKPEKRKKNAMIFIHIILHSTVHTYDFHIFIPSV